jgi:small conductance mechanosensitive channel
MDTNQWVAQLTRGAVIVALAVVGWVVVQFIGRQFLRVLSSLEHLREARRQQLITIVRVLRWTVRVLIVILAVLMLLSTFNIDITPLLASVGVAGLALGLGAQSLIKDLIGGLFILVENQYVVGDMIQVGDVKGHVERVTLRVTQLRDWNGLLHLIPNGEVRIVANSTKEWSRALVDLGVAYEEDLDRVFAVLSGVAEEFVQDPDVGPHLLETPQVLGPISLGDWAITIRVMAKTQPGRHLEIARLLRKRIVTTFEQENITMPYPRYDVHAHTEAWDSASS